MSMQQKAISEFHKTLALKTKMSFICLIIKKLFSQERFYTLPRFKTEASDFSEIMAYYAFAFPGITRS